MNNESFFNRMQAENQEELELDKEEFSEFDDKDEEKKPIIKIISIIFLILLLGLLFYFGFLTIKNLFFPSAKALVVYAGTDRQMWKNQSIALDGIYSGGDKKDKIEFEWVCDGGTLSSNSILTPTFTPPQDISEDVSFNCVLNAKIKNKIGKGASSSSGVKITVKNSTIPLILTPSLSQVLTSKSIDLSILAGGIPEEDTSLFFWCDCSYESSNLEKAREQCGEETLKVENADPIEYTAKNVCKYNQDGNYTAKAIMLKGLELGEARAMITVNKVPNNPPKVNAGSDLSVLPGKQVVLQGSATDIEKNALTYAWTCDGAGKLSNPKILKPTFTAPNVTVATKITCKLTVSDGANSVSDTMNVFVKLSIPAGTAGNSIPVANAGSDTEVFENGFVAIDGSKSKDANGDKLTYKWDCQGGSVDNNTFVKTIFRAPEVAKDTVIVCSLTVSDGKDQSTDTVNIKVKNISSSKNSPPIADAGPDQQTAPNTIVVLNGSQSYDSDKDVLSYSWTCNNVVVSSPATTRPRFVSPDTKTNMEINCSLTVSDGKEKSADSVKITVIAGTGPGINNPPLADAGNSIYVNEGDKAILDGSGSKDMDNDALTYKWICAKEIIISNDTSAFAQITAPQVSEETSFECVLTVKDSKYAISTDKTLVIVKNIPRPNNTPIARAGKDITVKGGKTVSLDGSNSYDPDGDSLVYYWFCENNGRVLRPNDAITPYEAPSTDKELNFSCMLNVSDGTLQSSDTIAVNVQPGTRDEGQNRPPVAVVKRTPLGNLEENGAVELDASQSYDPDNDVLSFLWQDCQYEQCLDSYDISDVNSSKPSLTVGKMNQCVQNCSIKCELIVTDARGLSSGSMIEIGVNNSIDIVNAGIDIDEKEGTEVRLQGAVQDVCPVGHYWFCSGNGSENGVIYSPDELNTTYKLPLVSQDIMSITCKLSAFYSYVSEKSDSLNVIVRDGADSNNSPIVDAGYGFEVNENQPGNLLGLAFDPDRDSFTSEWSCPGGIIEDKTSLATKYTAPSVSEDTTIECTLTVTDSRGGIGRDSISINIKNVNQKPVVSAGANKSIDEGTSTALFGSATDADGDTLTYSWVCTGGTLDDSNKIQPAFTAPLVGRETVYTCTFTVDDSKGGISQSSVDITVKKLNHPPTADAGPDYNVNYIYPSSWPVEIYLNGSGSDSDGDLITFAWSCSGGTVSNENRAKAVFVVPNDIQANKQITYICVLTVTDSKGATSHDSANLLVLASLVNDDKNKTVNAGIDVRILEGEQVILSGSTSNGVYNWSCTGGNITQANQQVGDNTGNPYVYYTAPFVDKDETYICTLNDGDGGEDSLNIFVVNKIIDVNNPPIAQTGFSSTDVCPGGSIELSNTSFDPDGDPITSHWSCSGATVSAYGVFSAPNQYWDYGIPCDLIVTDSPLNQSSQTTVIIYAKPRELCEIGCSPISRTNCATQYDPVCGTNNITYGNDCERQKACVGLEYRGACRNTPAPTQFTVSAGSDLFVNEGGTTTLQGFASGGVPLITYEWVCSGGSLSNPNISNPVFTALPVEIDTDYNCFLTATDGEGRQAYDSIKVTVKNRVSCTSFTYSNWSSCQNGTQTRTVVSSLPSGCVGGSPVLSQSCGVSDSPCTSFTYSNWSSCQNGTQTRTVVSFLPSGCVGGSPVLSQSCGVSDSPCTSFTYSNWSSCQNGAQTRTVVSSLPSGCTGGSPVLSQSCSSGNPCTSFTYSNWSSCQNGSQTRTVVSSLPSGCAGGNPVLSQSCSSDNRPPIVEVSSVGLLEENELATLHASVTDPDGDQFYTSWNCDIPWDGPADGGCSGNYCGGFLENNNTLDPRFVAPRVYSSKTLDCYLRAEDSKGGVNIDYFNIYVRNVTPSVQFVVSPILNYFTAWGAGGYVGFSLIIHTGYTVTDPYVNFSVQNCDDYNTGSCQTLAAGTEWQKTVSYVLENPVFVKCVSGRADDPSSYTTCKSIFNLHVNINGEEFDYTRSAVSAP